MCFSSVFLFCVYSLSKQKVVFRHSIFHFSLNSFLPIGELHQPKSFGIAEVSTTQEMINLITFNPLISMKKINGYACRIFFEDKISRLLLAVHSQCKSDKI